MKYSMCIPVLNDADTVQKALGSLYAQLPPDSEVIVVDGKSRDGTTEILRRYEAKGLLKLIVQRSNIGRARQIAFEHSSGDYIITGMDMDDILAPGSMEAILFLYHSRYEGAVLRCYDFFVVPRSAALKAGGWRDTGAAEDLKFIMDCERNGVNVAYRTDIKAIKDKRSRCYKGPFRVLESIRRFPGDTKAGYTKLKTKPSTRILWTVIRLYALTRLNDNRAMYKVLDFLIMNFGVST